MAEIGGIAAEQLRSYIERIERLEEEKAAIAADIREVYAQAKGQGFDPRIMRRVLRERKMDAADREEQELLLDTYKRALGMGLQEPEPVPSPAPAAAPAMTEAGGE